MNSRGQVNIHLGGSNWSRLEAAKEAIDQSVSKVNWPRALRKGVKHSIPKVG